MLVKTRTGGSGRQKELTLLLRKARGKHWAALEESVNSMNTKRL